MARFGDYPSEADRQAAKKRLENKRASLALEARQMVESGVPFENLELPRSFRSDASPAPPVREKDQKTEECATAALVAEKQEHAHDSPFAGTSLDGQKLLLAYKRRKVKKDVPHDAAMEPDLEVAAETEAPAATETDS